MVAKLSVKKNLSSLQVLKTLLVMLQDNYTMQEIVDKLNSLEPAPIFNNSVVSKYINTCRYAGFEIPKIHNRYFVTNMPFGFELSFDDISVLEFMQSIVRQDLGSKYNKYFDSFLEKIGRFSNKKITRIEKETYQVTVELFELAISEKRKIRLLFKNKSIQDCIPIAIVENKNKTYFHVVYKNKEKMVDANRLSGIQLLSEKFAKNYNDQVVIFELKSPLAERYKVRENERLMKSFDGHSITVSNHGESKEILFSRLLRYDDKCEIINPKLYREEMKQILTSALSNYGEV